MLISAQFIRQTEQPNQYWLIEFKLEQATELPVNFFIVAEGVQLSLFSQNTSNNQIQFLAKQSLSQTQSINIDFYNNLAWYFLDDFEKKLDLNKTNCLLVSEKNLAQSFYISKQFRKTYSMVLILEAQTQFPFQIKPARFMFENLPIEAASMIGACPLLEDWKIPNRLCNLSGLPGCFDGDLKDFENFWQPPPNWLVIHL